MCPNGEAFVWEGANDLPRKRNGLPGRLWVGETILINYKMELI